jgi:tetratricopeptide (TPR) repeat protein
LLGQQQQDAGQRSTAEETLKKGINYSERAVALDPERSLLKHNLETARRMLEDLHEDVLEQEVNKLYGQKRYAEAVALWSRSIKEQEQEARSGQDPEKALTYQAYRLHRLAWILAHCPDRSVRDTKAAVTQARRATELRPDASDYWRTLALVQYRNGDWRESLATLERMKATAGGLDASGWFVSAMDLHRLDRKDEARAAFRKAIEWIGERLHQAQDDAFLRFQYELMRPGIEALHREAEELLEGKDPDVRELSLKQEQGTTRS